MALPPIPLLLVTALLAALSIREMITPVPVFQPKAPDPAAATEAGDAGDISDDPFEFGDEDEDFGDEAQQPAAGSAVDDSTLLNEWLADIGAPTAEWPLEEEGYTTVGHLLKADLTDNDLQLDFDMKKETIHTLQKALDTLRQGKNGAGGGKKKRKAADASEFDGGSTSSDSSKRQPPVPPMKAALASCCRYSFYVGMILINFQLGDRLFAMVGVPNPAVYTWAVENRLQANMGLMAISHLGPMLLGVSR